MQLLTKPKVVISACLGYEKCRYNGEIFHNQFLEKLKDMVQFIPVCPETSIGLGVPREVIRIIYNTDGLSLYQPSTDKDLTKDMQSFSNHFVNHLPQVQGFILKSKSPSCAYKDAKHYSGMEKGAHSVKGSGMFAQALKEHFPLYPFIDDGQLNDFKYREHFLIKLYMLSKLHQIAESVSLTQLIDFHNENELLIQCYSRLAYKELTAMLNTEINQHFADLVNAYSKRLLKALEKVSRYTSNIGILRSSAQSISPGMQPKEMRNIEDVIDKYKNGNLPFSVPLYVIKTYALQYENQKLLRQTIFDPFPADMMELRDSGKVRI